MGPRSSVRSRRAARVPVRWSQYARMTASAGRHATRPHSPVDTAHGRRQAAAYPARRQPARCSTVHSHHARVGRLGRLAMYCSNRCGRSELQLEDPMQPQRSPTPHRRVRGSAPSARSRRPEKTPAARAASKPTKQRILVDRAKPRSRDRVQLQRTFPWRRVPAATSRPASKCLSSSLQRLTKIPLSGKESAKYRLSQSLFDDFTNCANFEQTLPKRMTIAKRSSTNSVSG